MYCISISELHIKPGAWNAAKFLVHAAQANLQAYSATGNHLVLTSTDLYDMGVQMTVTVWESKQYLREYRQSTQVVKASRQVATALRVYDYKSDRLPASWEEAQEILNAHGRVVFDDSNKASSEKTEERQSLADDNQSTNNNRKLQAEKQQQRLEDWSFDSIQELVDD